MTFNQNFSGRQWLSVGLGLLIAVANGLAATEYVEGEVLVTFKETTDLPAARQALQTQALTLVKHFKELSNHRRRPTGLVRWPGHTTAALIEQLSKEATVEAVEPNYLRWATAVVPTNTTLFAQQWGLQNTGQVVNGVTGTAGADIKFASAWSVAQPVVGEVVVAVLDTGVDYTHPDLVSNIWTNPGGISADTYVGDYHGYDFAGQKPDPMDSGLHGTHVSGTIAAMGIPSGVVGVSPQAKILALKASSDGNSFTESAIIEAIQYATMLKNSGVNIVAINASFGGGGQSSIERSAIQSAGAAGIIFCAAAGNQNSNDDTTPTFPASYRLPNMLVVTATDQNDALASFSDYGTATVDLAAPGVNILSTIPVAQAGTTATVWQAGVAYSANGLTYAGVTTGLTATVYDCGFGHPEDFPAAVNGNIALISRGGLMFSEKLTNAMVAGARAAIIYNNVSGNFQGTLQTANQWVPAVSISRADGLALQALLPTTMTVVNARDPAQMYQLMDGTSMATPHVAGAVAFAAQNYPAETMAQRMQRILGNVDVLNGLLTKVQTGGRLNLRRIVAPSDGMPPVVHVTSPASGATYTTSQTVTLTASATDNTGVTKVSFYDSGALKTADLLAPYTYAWHITSADNGVHYWTARASDAVGNMSTSAVVTLTVSIPTGCAGSAVRTLPGSYTVGRSNPVAIAVTPNNSVANFSLTDTPPSGWSVANIDDGGRWDGVNQQVVWGPFAGHAARSLHYSVVPPTSAGVQCFNGTVSFDSGGCAVLGNICLNPAAPVVCAYDVSPSSATFVASGGAATLAVAVDGSCAWTASSGAGWLTITGGSSGNGSGTVSYSVAANTGPARSDSITIADQSIPVSQANGCLYGLSANSTNLLVDGGSGSLGVTTGSDCNWLAISTAPDWIHIVGNGVGTGSGVINYIVDANPLLAPRTASLIVQGRVFTVSQTPVTCTYTLAEPEGNLPARGGSGTVTVNVASPCPWVASSDSDWLQTASTGSGTGSVQFTAGANTTANSRTGTLAVATEVFSVHQPPEHSPVLTGGPAVTNALLNVRDLVVVPAGTNVAFWVTATDADGDPIAYQWEFGDGTAAGSNAVLHSYATNSCGVYTATVVVADGIMPSPTGTLQVAVACQLDVTQLQLNPNFAKRNADSCTLTAAFVPAANLSAAQRPVTVEIGDAVVDFTLSKTGHAATTNGTCTVTYTKRRGWSIAFALKAGAWHSAWTRYNVVNATVKKGVPVQIPVVVVIGNDAYAAVQPLLYTASTNKTGTAK